MKEAHAPFRYATYPHPRKASSTAGIPQLLGIPKILDDGVLPGGATSTSLVTPDTSTTFSGTGNAMAAWASSP